MRKQNPLIQGTLYLILAGFLSRIIGFFYRIFLSQTIGAEGMGIYQLTSPVFALTFALCSAGVQTAVSKHVAKYISGGYKKAARGTLAAGLSVSVSLSLFCTLFLSQNADFIAERIIAEARCAPLIRILAWSIPLEAVHACVNGYYYGRKKAGIPALTQLVEQTVRVLTVMALYHVITAAGRTPALSITVIGIVVGEAAAMVVCVSSAWLYFYRETDDAYLNPLTPAGKSFPPRVYLRDILFLAAPLSANRVIIDLLCSAEAILIPIQLKLFGLDDAGALSIYGVLTGMALPIILFPSAITNSLSVILLPVISEQEAKGNTRGIVKAVRKTIFYCSMLGAACTLCFLLLGNFMGTVLFHSEMAGEFIVTLSFICPFLYLTTTLNSILNGLGKTSRTFLFSLAGISTRLLFTFFAIPRFGILAYLWGLLCSQLVMTGLSVLALRGYIRYGSRKTYSY